MLPRNCIYNKEYVCARLRSQSQSSNLAGTGNYTIEHHRMHNCTYCNGAQKILLRFSQQSTNATIKQEFIQHLTTQTFCQQDIWPPRQLVHPDALPPDIWSTSHSAIHIFCHRFNCQRFYCQLDILKTHPNPLDHLRVVG